GCRRAWIRQYPLLHYSITPFLQPLPQGVAPRVNRRVAAHPLPDPIVQDGHCMRHTVLGRFEGMIRAEDAVDVAVVERIGLEHAEQVQAPTGVVTRGETQVER